MKKKLLPISLLCLLGMIVTACGGGSSQESNNSASSNPQSQESSDQGGSSSQEAGKSSSSENSSSAQASSSSQAQSSSQQASSSSQAQSSSQAPNPTGVTLDKTSASVIKGQTLQLTATVAPANANNKEIQWSSEDEDIVTVSKTGLVNAVGYGEAKVTAKIKGTNLKAECVVSVIDEINSITIKNKSVFTDFLEDDIESLSIEVDPAKNVSELVTAGVLKVTSSNTEVASISGLTITGKKAGKSTITATLFGKSDSFELTVGAAIPGEPYTILNAMNKGIVEAPFNGNTGKTSAITTTCFELKGLIMAVAANGETGYNAILDDGTAAVYLQVNKASADPIPVAVGDYAQVTCKFTNYYGLLEGVARTAETNKNASWIPAKDVVKLAAPETPIVPTLNAPVDMTGDQYNEYFAICKTNGTKNAAGATWTAMKYVNILGTYNQAFADADKGKYQISDKYGLAPIGEFKLDEPFDGQKSTLTAFLIGANTGKGKSNAIVTGQTPVAVESFVFDQAPQTIVHGNTLQLTYTTTPAGSYSRNVEWSSSDNTVATVDEKGLVTGIYEGQGSKTATITVKVGTLEKSIVITVFGETVHATAVELAPTASVYVGDDLQLTYTTTPAMVSDTPVWSSDNEAVATVDQKGLVKGVATGTANITLKLNDNVSARCAVTVSIEPGSAIDNPLTVAQAIAIGQEVAHNTQTEKQYFVKGIVSKIVSNDLATDYANATFWLANGENTAEGFEAYRVKLNQGVDGANLKIGSEAVLKCNIKRYNSTIETNTGALIMSLVYADRPVTSLSLDNEALSLKVGEDATLKATYAPVYTTETLAWSSSDNAVATVENGKVTAVAAGTAIITVKANDRMQATCTVTVTDGSDVPPAGPVTVTKTVADLKADNGWENGGVVNSVKIGKVNFTFTGDSGDSKYYDSGSNIRIYIKANGSGSVGLAADSGYTVKSVTITYVWNKGTGTFPLESGVAADVNAATKSYAIGNTAAANEQLRITAISVTYAPEGVAPVEIAQPVGNFSGYAVSAQDGSNIFVDIALANDKAFIEVGSLLKDTKAFTFNKETGLLTIDLGTYGTLTATYDEENNKLINCGIEGAAAAYLSNNNSIVLNAAANYWNCDGTTEELRNQFIRRYRANGASSWTVDNNEEHTDRIVSDTTNFVSGTGAMSVRPYSGSGNAVGLSLKNDFAEAKALKNIGFWVYNSSNSDIALRTWVYTQKGLSGAAEIGGLTAKANGWTYCRMGFDKTIYNFNISNWNGSSNALVFDDIVLF